MTKRSKRARSKARGSQERPDNHESQKPESWTDTDSQRNLRSQKRIKENGLREGHDGQLESSSRRAIYTDYVISQDEIRILLLEPASAMDAPIVCNFETASLARRQKYEALSYTWEPPVAGLTLPDEEIRLCGQPMKIKGNLSQALKRLRFPNTPRRLWVDALCINQEDHAERSYQVSIMAQIYRNAKVVQVWLGEDFGDAKLTITYLQSVYRLRAYLLPLSELRTNTGGVANIEKIHDLLLGPQTELGKLMRRTYDDEDLRSEWAAATAVLRKHRWVWTPTSGHMRDIERRALEDFLLSKELMQFFERSYFTRRWVLQELHHARHAEIRYGSETISWQKMQTAYEVHLRISHKGFQYYFQREVPVLSYRGTIRQSRAKGILRLLKLLDEVEAANCQDPRDEVYALLGLVGQTGLVPDYSLSVNETWITVARAAVEEGLAVEVIGIAASQLAGSGTRSDLPSWVPDLQDPRPVQESGQLQFDAFVDSENRLICNLNCFSEVVFYNGWALIREEVKDAVIDEVMQVSQGSRETIRDYYRSYPKDLPLSIPFVFAPFELRDGDLLCTTGKEAFRFAMRAVPIDGSVEANVEQEWTVLGAVDVDMPWRAKTEGISRRLKIV